MATGEKADIELDPGEYLFGALLKDPFGMSNPVVIEQTVRPGSTYTYRLSFDGNGRPDLHRTL
jgi:hypothetical protein